MLNMSFSTVTNREQGKFLNALVSAVLQKKKIYLITDLDGTLFPFSANPEDVKLDPVCGQGVRAIRDIKNISLCALTGRPVLQAKKMLADVGDVSIIGSHGGEHLKEDGKIDRYIFSPDQEQNILGFKKAIRDLYSEFNSHGLVVELDKHGSAGLNVASMDTDLGGKVLAKARDELKNFESETFKIVQEGPNEIEIRPQVFGKDFGILNYIKPEKDSIIFFLCDSLGQQGTDTAAAVMLNDKEQFEHGYVIMVLNGRNKIPDHNALYAPFDVFESPSHLGRELLEVSYQLTGRPPATLTCTSVRSPK